MSVDYIHYRLPYSEMALLGNLPTFFYFGITLLPLKKKSCKLHVRLVKVKIVNCRIPFCKMTLLGNFPTFNLNSSVQDVVELFYPLKLDEV